MHDRKSPFASPGPGSQQDFACRRLRDAIVGCELAPGAVLSESAVARRFGLNRAAMRHALVRLSAAGLVASESRRGWQVAPVTGRELGQVVAARRRIEPALADLVLSPSDAHSLRPLHDTARAARRGGDVASARHAGRALRDALAARLGNPFLERALGDAWDRGERIAALAPGSDFVAGAADCGGLLDALETRDEAGARDEIARAIDAFEARAAHVLLDAAEIDPSTLAAPAPTITHESPSRVQYPDRGDQ